jgi:hypothetical protein
VPYLVCCGVLSTTSIRSASEAVAFPMVLLLIAGNNKLRLFPKA